MRTTAVCILLVSCAFVGADHYYRQAYPQPILVTPSYGGGYNQQISGVAELIDAINKLTKRIETLESVLAQKGMNVSDLPPHIPVFQARCAGCHDAAVSAKKGGGLSLLDNGREVQLTAEQKLEVIQRVHGVGDPSYDMPRNGQPLNKDEYSAVIQGMRARPQKMAAPKEKGK